jgi:hypothetical protein
MISDELVLIGWFHKGELLDGLLLGDTPSYRKSCFFPLQVYYKAGPECPFGLANLTLAVVLTVDAIGSVFVLTPLVLPQRVWFANRLPL